MTVGGRHHENLAVLREGHLDDFSGILGEDDSFSLDFFPGLEIDEFDLAFAGGGELVLGFIYLNHV